MGKDPVNRQQHKVRETDKTDKNNYAEDWELTTFLWIFLLYKLIHSPKQP